MQVPWTWRPYRSQFARWRACELVQIDVLIRTSIFDLHMLGPVLLPSPLKRATTWSSK